MVKNRPDLVDFLIFIISWLYIDFIFLNFLFCFLDTETFFANNFYQMFDCCLSHFFIFVYGPPIFYKHSASRYNSTNFIVFLSVHFMFKNTFQLITTEKKLVGLTLELGRLSHCFHWSNNTKRKVVSVEISVVEIGLIPKSGRASRSQPEQLNSPTSSI